MATGNATTDGRLRGATVVITGASSGIGRAAALEFARRGARVVAAARREEPLTSLVRACERLGSRALAVPTDVTDETAVEALARRAVEEFGRVDVWVNNAGVYLAGRFEDVPSADFRRVLEINLLGNINGARAAVRQFRRQGGGILINNDSIAGIVPMAHFSAYTASKFGLLGFSLALRQELRGTGIEVCTVLPSSVDTPIFQHAGNYDGRQMRALTPTYAPQQVARTMVSLAERPRRLAVVGGFGWLLTRLYPLVPSLIEWGAARIISSQHFRAEARQPTSGNLFTPMPEGTGPGGGWTHDIGLLTRNTPDPIKAHRTE
jgi:NAD(P)-dependent dehydrogenase (short-subunit alcohol dehydrogenase family)